MASMYSYRHNNNLSIFKIFRFIFTRRRECEDGLNYLQVTLTRKLIVKHIMADKKKTVYFSKKKYSYQIKTANFYDNNEK